MDTAFPPAGLRCIEFGSITMWVCQGAMTPQCRALHVESTVDTGTAQQLQMSCHVYSKLLLRTAEQQIWVST